MGRPSVDGGRDAPNVNVYTGLWQDPREFSDDGSDDSGFEESVGSAERNKEQHLQNDKYDLALEVSQASQGLRCRSNAKNWNTRRSIFESQTHVGNQSV